VFRLRIPQTDYEELRRLTLVSMPKEAAAFALAGISNTRDDTDILVRRAIAVPPDQYQTQEEHHLRVSPEAINGLIALCEANGLGAVICHSHPGEIPYSPTDDFGERRIVETLRAFIPAAAPTASLLFTPTGVRGRVWLPAVATPFELNEVVIVGRSITRVALQSGTVAAAISDIYDRQARAFGEQGHNMMAGTKAAVVGIGGTGSPTAEQLLRLGLHDLVIIDPDDWHSSNITRVYGSYADSSPPEGESRRSHRQTKAEIVAQHLQRINPEARIRVLTQNVANDEAAQSLRDRDIIFLCTDDHWGRSVVNELAYQYLIPTINLGMRISSERGVIDHAVGVVDVLRPDLPCLWCRQTLSADRIAAESMPLMDREKLAAEGYVQGLDEPTPSVISINTTLSGLAITLFIQLVTDFMGQSGDIVRLNYDALQSTVRRGRSSPLDRCICKKVRGFGDLHRRSTLLASA
jgi:molybdopterin-synthase adenylyltransferase